MSKLRELLGPMRGVGTLRDTGPNYRCPAELPQIEASLPGVLLPPVSSFTLLLSSSALAPESAHAMSTLHTLAGLPHELVEMPESPSQASQKRR